MNHSVLLGDSVFDNAAYIDGGPDVVTQLRQRLPSGWRVSREAVDGSTVADIPQQLERVPIDASHLVVSVGGNDALRYSSVLSAPSRSVADSLEILTDVRQRFQLEYRGMLETVLRRGLPAAVCTIYDPRYPDSAQRRVAITALSIMNDCIIREAVGLGIPLLDLRAVCDADVDFANPIEPSIHGGWKIAGVIASALSEHDFSRARCEVFTR
jgi:hypothetical protein